MTLLDDVTALIDASLEEPVEGMTLWSFHTKDRATPLDEDEIVARIESGKGVYAIELVFDQELELFQRGDGTRIKSHADLKRLMRERAVPMMSAPMPKTESKSALTAASDGKKRGPIHGALLGRELKKR